MLYGPAFKQDLLEMWCERVSSMAARRIMTLSPGYRANVLALADFILKQALFQPRFKYDGDSSLCKSVIQPI